MKAQALLIGLLFSVSTLFAGNAEIRGKVTRSDNSQAISQAYVVLEQNGIVIKGGITQNDGTYSIKGLHSGIYDLRVKAIGYQLFFQKNININDNEILDYNVVLSPNVLDDVVVEAEELKMEERSKPKSGKRDIYNQKSVSYSGDCLGMVSPSVVYAQDYDGVQQEFNTESYDLIKENKFLSVAYNPLSTFSIDVDRASYSNVRRFLNSNALPPVDAVRIEELINYFDYGYPQPQDEHPFSVQLEMGNCPWNANTKLLHVGIKGKEMDASTVPASNLVFLVDVSGSMSDANKLPLLKSAFKVLIDKLRPQDKVAMVVYAGAAGVVLPSTSGSDKEKIKAALDMLESGGSTAGGEGIKLAYKVAKENFISNGNNRVILATDGDFNIGASSDAEMVRLIEEKRNDGVFLTVLGFGMGNYKDSKMEKIADAGNGNYAYIDNILEAKKMLGTEIWGTLFTIAKDVKIQIEFNPNKVKAYRLVGYENRLLANEDFNDDKKDAGEIGAGHTVTALYEIIPADDPNYVPNVDPLKYQSSKINSNSDDWLTIKLRYKKPDQTNSILIEKNITDKMLNKYKPSDDFMFASAVAEFGMLLRKSEFKAHATYQNVIDRAKNAKGIDKDGYRSDFIKLAEIASLLDS